MKGRVVLKRASLLSFAFAPYRTPGRSVNHSFYLERDKSKVDIIFPLIYVDGS